MAVIPRAVHDAAAAIEEGRLVVMPTDTVYGLAARPDDPAATGAVFRTKGRDRGLTLPVLVADLEASATVARFDARGTALAEAHWPGPLTLVLPRTRRAASWDLGGDGETVGVRVPAHPLARALLSLTGPLAVTSANRSGEPPGATCDGLREALGDRVAVYLCEEAPLEGAASTVVDLAHGRATVLRRGDLAAETLSRSLPPAESLLDSRPSP